MLFMDKYTLWLDEQIVKAYKELSKKTNIKGDYAK